MDVPQTQRETLPPDAAPAIVSTSSHRKTAAPLGRFIGQLPLGSRDTHASKVQRSRLHRLKREAISHFRYVDDQGDGDGDGDVFGEDGHGVQRRMRRIRVRRRSAAGKEIEQVFEAPDDDELEHGHGHWRKGGLPNDEAGKWVGESFDIGQEYENLEDIVGPAVDPGSSSTRTESTDIPRANGAPEANVGPSSLQTGRPSFRTQDTQDSFFTARTEIDSVSPPFVEDRDSDTTGPSPHSSTRALLGNDQLGPDDETVRHIPSQRLKSAFETGSKKGSRRRKSVSFFVDRVMPKTPTGPPTDPVEVLSRAGDQVQGTSAGAQATLECASYPTDPPLGWTSVLQDRLLVRVAEHRDDGLVQFNESVQRRNPCRSMDPFEEYIAVLRDRRVELYQRWSNPFSRMRRRTLRLCFIIPLQSSHTTLSVFNETDMSIALVTSVSKFADSLKSLSRRQAGSAHILVHKIKDSKQYQSVKSSGDRGSHIFILKLGERSRAIDWYWEIWRNLGGDVPKMADISAPAFSAQIRLDVRDLDNLGANSLKGYSPGAIVQSSWKSLEKSVNVQGQDKNDLRLAWRTSEGMLEWIAYDTTVQGKPRYWALLATLAMWESEMHPMVLELLHTTHQPSIIRLDDGSVLKKPPSIEGYLIRHTPRAKAKEHLYIFTHDGSMFLSPQSRARPPDAPGKPGSLPADLFPKVYDEFQRGENARLAQSIARSAGFVDMRNIERVRLCSDQGGQKGCFDVTLEGAETHRFEAHSTEAAEEWVTRLEKLLDYWKQRHRVDARMRMQVMACSAKAVRFADTALDGRDDAMLAEIWNWCAIEGCSGVNMAGRLFMKKGVTDKFRANNIVLTGGMLVSFKIKARKKFYPKRKSFSLFGSYVYSGMFAQEEVREPSNASVFSTTTRRYIDGLVSSDGSEDTTFCVRIFAGKKKSGWGKKRKEPWAQEGAADADTEADDLQASMTIPRLSTTPPRLLIFRARSKLERDRWVWAINAEMERQVRSHLVSERALRYGSGSLP